MSLYNNFHDENKVDVLWEKIDIMFEDKNAIIRVSIFRKIVRLRYQDGSSMGLINQITSLEAPLANEVLTLLLLGSLLDSWVTLIVTLGHARPEGKPLTLEKVKSTFLNEQSRRKDQDAIADPKALVTESDVEKTSPFGWEEEYETNQMEFGQGR